MHPRVKPSREVNGRPNQNKVEEIKYCLLAVNNGKGSGRCTAVGVQFVGIYSVLS